MTTSVADFRPVTKAEPCEVCGSSSWCRRSDDGCAECHRRVDHVAGYRLFKKTSGGFGLYRAENDTRPATPTPTKAAAVASETPARDWAADCERYVEALTDERLAELAGSLGVTADSLREIDCGWDGEGYTFPEKNARGGVIGIARRFVDGAKGFCKGGRRGLTIPWGLDDLGGVVLVVEGPSDVAACLTMGVPAVGRPSNLGGAGELTELLRERSLIVMAECDCKANGEWPGRDGARAVAAKLAAAWGRPVTWALPPGNSKDVRTWLTSRGVTLDDPAALREAGREFVTAIEGNLSTIKPDGLTEAPPTDSLPDEPGPGWRSIREIAREGHSEGIKPISTSYATLDNALNGGFRPEGVVILGGRTGFAKSTLATNIVRRVAAAGNSVLFVKLEERDRLAVWQLHAAASQVPLRVLLDGIDHVDPDTRRKLVDGWEFIKNLPIRISTDRGLSAITRTIETHVSDGGKLVVIDQLSMIDAGEEIGFRTATAVSNRLRILAKDCSVPILCVSQINRNASRNTKERLGLNDLRDSGALENDASAVLLVDRVRDADGAGNIGQRFRVLECVLPKNRYGRAVYDGSLELWWWPSICRIEDPGTQGVTA